MTSVPMRNAGRWPLSLLFAALVFPAQAHDFWLSGERTHDGAPALRMHLGDKLHAEETRPYKTTATADFRLFTASGTRDLAQDASEGSEPFHVLPKDTPTPALAVIDRNPVVLTLPNAKFADYLSEEHLDAMLALHPVRKREDRERYTRHIKLLVTDEDGGTAGLHAREIGLPLEIVLLDTPGEPGPDRYLRARVTFEGKALPGRTLTIVHDADGRFDAGGRARTAVTDTDGIARFAYDRPGFWLLRMVHMQACNGCDDADWRSYWAAYAIQKNWLRAPDASNSSP